MLHQWLLNGTWQSNKSSEFEKDVEIWQGEELLKALGSINFTKDTVKMWTIQLAKIDDFRKQLKDSPGDDKQRYTPMEGKDSKSKILSQGSTRILASIYRTLLFVFQNNNEDLAAFRLIRQCEFKFGMSIKSYQ